MKEYTKQNSLEKANVRELSPDSRVWHRISETIKRKKRRTRSVQAFSVTVSLFVLACAGLGYFMISRGVDGDIQYSDDHDIHPLSETMESDIYGLLRDESYSSYLSSVAHAYVNSTLTSGDLETFFECVTEVNETFPLDESSDASHESNASDMSDPEFDFRYNAHSQCLMNLQLPRLKARHYEASGTPEPPI